MMNIRDYFSINKTKTTNKIKILDLLGFEPDIEIDSTQYNADAFPEVDWDFPEDRESSKRAITESPYVDFLPKHMDCTVHI